MLSFFASSMISSGESTSMRTSLVYGRPLAWGLAKKPTCIKATGIEASRQGCNAFDAFGPFTRLLVIGKHPSKGICRGGPGGRLVQRDQPAVKFDAGASSRRHMA